MSTRKAAPWRGLLAVSAVVLAFTAVDVRAASQVGVIDRITTPTVDAVRLIAESNAREANGGPMLVAELYDAFITPELNGTWETLDNGMLSWRLVVESPAAASISLGFTRFSMPEDGRMLIYASDGSAMLSPITAADNSESHELWTPIVRSSEIVIDVTIPEDQREDLELELTAIGGGFREFLVEQYSIPSSVHSCSYAIDVACPEADDWQDEVRSVVKYTYVESPYIYTCSGALVNNTAQDGTPYILTAYHCGLRTNNDHTAITYFNYEIPSCGSSTHGSESQYIMGATYRAGEYNVDFCLFEMNAAPPASYDAIYAGWDHSSTLPVGGAGIHHPKGEEKCISLDDDPTFAYPWYDGIGYNSHFLISAIDDGWIDHGSSGSPWFNPDHRIVGTLTGGGPEGCLDDKQVLYGRLYYAWDIGSSASSRLRDWLDPSSTGAVTLDDYDPNQTSGMVVTGTMDIDFAGPVGGGFGPAYYAYLVENVGSTSITYSASSSESWLMASPTFGTLIGGDSTTIYVLPTASASTLAGGVYHGTVDIINQTNGVGSATVNATLTVIDCNDNGVPDATDIASGDSSDCNQNEIPDECEPEFVILGDTNCDCSIDVFDIDPFVKALVDPAGYAIDYPNCKWDSADMNGDEAVDVFDIDPFVQALVGGE